MEWYYVLAILIGSLIFFMLLGLPVVFAFFAANIIGAMIFMGGEKGVAQLVRNAIDSTQSFSLLPIPLFIFMGEIMFHTGVAARAIDAVDKLIARVPGRLSLVAIAGGTLFSSVSGSTIANTAMLGSTLLPEMYKRGYKPEIAIGPIVAVGGIAMLIPPSALAVLLGSVAIIPISDLLLASIIPALILAVLFYIYVMIRCWLDPTIAPTYDISDITWWQRIKPFFIYVLPLISIFVVVVGSIVAGIATPTESAALGTVSALIIAAAYRSLRWDNFVESVRQTIRFSVMTLFIICGSITFSQILAFSEASGGLTDVILNSELAPILILLGMLAILMILGCFMDQVSMIKITMPLYMPVVEQLGYNVVWFGVLTLMIMEISLATPPFGLLLFVAKGAAPDGTTMRQVIISVLPFLFLTLSVVALIILFPQVTLILPELVAN